MEKYPPSLARKSQHGHSGGSAGRPVSAKVAAQNAKLREKAERSVAKMQSQMEADRRKQEVLRHEAVVRLTATWKNEIIPNWAEMDQSPRVRKLVSEGIPTSLRGTVWPLLIGNRQKVTEILYDESKREAFRVKRLTADREEALERQRTATVRFADSPSVAEDGRPESPLCDPAEDVDDEPKVQQRPSSDGVTGKALAVEHVHISVSATDASAEDAAPGPAPDSPGTDCGREPTGDMSPDDDVEANRIDSVQIDDLNVDASVDLLRLSVSERRLSSRVQTVNLIQWDIPRTFPTLSFFHNGAPLNQSLENVLMAYAAYRPDVGYVQGMSFLVAMLLLQMDEYSAFQCLVNLMKRRNQLEFYRLNLEAVTSFSDVFNHYFMKFLPLLYRHFEEQGMSHAMFLVDWNLTIFSKALPLDCAIRIWDSYLVEGEVFVMRAAIGLLRLYAPRLSQMTMESIAPFLMRLPEDTNAANVFSNISEIRISHSNYNSVCERYKFNLQEKGTAPMGTLSKLSEMLSPQSPPSTGSGGSDGKEQVHHRRPRQVMRDFVASFLVSKESSTS